MNVAVLGTLAATAFNINALSKLLWLDASDSETVTQSEGKVSAWNDKSGNSRHVSQGTADYQPTISDNKITFDGLNDHLTNSSPFMWNTGSVAVFAVMSAPATNATFGLVESNTSSNNPCYAPIVSGEYAFDGDKMRVFMRNDYSSTNGFASHYVTNADTVLDGTLHLFSFFDSGTNATGYADGVDPVGDDIDKSGQSLTLNTFTIGGWLRTSFVAPMNLTLAELIVTTYAIGTANKSDIESYLMNKWSIS